ncbi:MAG: PQQ-dependent sugar dehydrogenase [bacterium]
MIHIISMQTPRTHLFSLALLIALPGLAPSPATAEPVTPTAAAPAATGYKLTKVVDGLEHPWAIAWLPDGSALITEREGRIRLLSKAGTLAPNPLKGVPEVLSIGQGGLLDIALHPKFAQNRLVYFTHSTGTAKANNTRLVRAKLSQDADTLTDVQTIFDASPKKSGPLHFGSRLAFMPDGTLLITVGDGFNRRDDAQNTASNLGKVLRLTDEGKPAPGNPFINDDKAKPEVWSYGHRNPQGLTIDTAGRVWQTEHGPLGGDELNLIEKGKNYGWPKVTFGTEYSGATISDDRTLPGMEDAKVVWTPVLAASGLAFYSGDKFPQWKGDLFAGGLVSKQVRRIDLDDNGKVLGQQTIKISQRVRDVRNGPDGYLYILTDEDNGQLIRVEPASDAPPAAGK